MKFILTILCLIVSLSPSLHAQDKKKVKLKIKTLCFKKIPSIDKLQIHESEDKFITANLYQDTFSEEVTYQGPPTLTLSYPGQSTFNLAVPANTKNLVLLLMPSRRNGKASYEVIAFPHSLEKFPFGTRKFINLTKKDIALVIHNKKLLLKSNKPVDLTLKLKDTKTKRFPIRFEYRSKNKWVIFSTTFWSLNENKRNYIFFYTDPKTKAFTFHGIPEYNHPDEDE